MRALCWHGKGDVRCDTVPDPRIEHPRDALIEDAPRGYGDMFKHKGDGCVRAVFAP